MAKAQIDINNMARRSDKRLSNPQMTSKIKRKDGNIDVDIVNISRRGLRFKSGSGFKSGEKLKFELHSSDGGSNLSLNIKAKIVNDYGNKDDGVFEYGVRFSRLLYWYEMNCIHDFVYMRESG